MNRCWAGYAFFAMVFILFLASILSGCGVKGPLYTPTEKAKEDIKLSDKPQKEQTKQ